MSKRFVFWNARDTLRFLDTYLHIFHNFIILCHPIIDKKKLRKRVRDNLGILYMYEMY